VTDPAARPFELFEDDAGFAALLDRLVYEERYDIDT